MTSIVFLQCSAMSEAFQNIQDYRQVFDRASVSFSEAELRAANINLNSGLATDFLNPLNEYLMLAEMVAMGVESAELLQDWPAVSYRTHFEQAQFAGSACVVAVFDQLDQQYRSRFEAENAKILGLIADHKTRLSDELLQAIAQQRDRIAQMITPHHVEINFESSDAISQDNIDALFD